MVNNSIQQIRNQIQDMETAIKNLVVDESTLMGKIEKKKGELERAEKRLKSLQVVR